MQNPWNTHKPLPYENTTPVGFARPIERLSEDEKMARRIAISNGKITKCLRGKARGVKAPKETRAWKHERSTGFDRKLYQDLIRQGYTRAQAEAVATR